MCEPNSFAKCTAYCKVSWLSGEVPIGTNMFFIPFMIYPLNLQLNRFVTMIRQAKILEIPDILRITKACAAHMAGFGIYQCKRPGMEVQAEISPASAKGVILI
jgi:hypothetical protein